MNAWTFFDFADDIDPICGKQRKIIAELIHGLDKNCHNYIYNIFLICQSARETGGRATNQCLSQDLDFFSPKKELLKKMRELFAKERSYPSTTKLHDEARKQVRNLYITFTKYTKQNIVPL